MKKTNAPQLVAAVTSLGCPKNFVDTEIIAASFLKSGIGLTPDEDEADIVFINTCAFIESARKESFAAIKHALQWKKHSPETRIVAVGGCINEWVGAPSARMKFPEVDLWTGIDSLENIGKMLLAAASGKKPEKEISTREYIYDHNTPRILLTPGHYAWLKIADGCDNKCAYCSIPSIRGGLRSRTGSSVLKEAERLLDSGVKELIVIAQDIGAFGRDKGMKNGLENLVRKLDRLDGDFLIRLMYLHPASVTESLCEALAESTHLARCIEMPIQHISDPVLLRMGRHAGEEKTREAVRMIREKANCAIRTTFMTGFPGETKEDFNRLMEFTAEARFERMGCFSYSKEAGTRAASMPDQVPHRTSEARRRKLMELQEEISLDANLKLVGCVREFIADSVSSGGKVYGRSIFDAPDIDNGVVITGCPRGIRPGDRIHAAVTGAGAYDLTAEFLNNK